MNHEDDAQQRDAQQERDDLVVQHMGLVGHIVRETMSRVPSHVNRDDLHSAGLAALVKAGRSFQDERGVPFVRYAASRIRGAILDELRSIDWASRSVRRRGRELDQARTQLANRLGRSPDNTEVAAELGLSLAEITGNDEDVARANVLSLQGSTTETSFAEIIASPDPGPEDLVEHQERLEYLVDAIAELPERLQAVVRGYFLEERPMADLAADLGVSESRISQMRAEALVLLRDAMNSALDPDLVPEHTRPDGCAAQRRDAYFRAVAARHTAGRRSMPRGLEAAG
jgi:RNA polymerase sigma factor for flagellar operon FliA